MDLEWPEVPAVAETQGLVRSRARSAYLTLRSRIIRGELPPLHRLKVAELSQELDTNSSAVREALSRLTAEHLVDARDQRGFRVAAMSLAELDDLTRTRTDIETMMLRRSIEAGHGDPAWEARLRAAWHAVLGFEGDRTSADGQAVHNEFHEALLSACQSPSLLRVRGSLFLLSQRYRSFAFHTAGPAWRVDAEHEELGEAALAGDADRAAAALAAHIAGTAAIVRNGFLQAHRPAAAGF